MPTPDRVWQCLNIDYLGPFPNGWYLLVLIDQRSRFRDVEFVRNTSANLLLSYLEWVFSIYGIPDTVVSDNGPPFQSHQVRDFMRQNGIQHRRITPLWPQENAEAERFMKPLTKICQTSYIGKTEWKIQIYRFLFAYRSTPHCTTKIPPAELMFNCKIRYSIPSFDYNIQEDISNKVERNDREAQEKSKTYTDTRKHAKERNINIGDRVLVKQQKKNKITPKFEPHPYRVVDKNDTMVTAESEGTGNVSRETYHSIKKFLKQPKFLTHNRRKIQTIETYDMNKTKTHTMTYQSNVNKMNHDDP